jgi:hypothetical protein
MPVNPPVLITRANVGKGPGMVLVSLGAPAGELGKGPIENFEILRIAMTHDTFREITQLFVRTLNELEPRPPVGPGPGHPRKFTRPQLRPVPEKG